MHDTIAYYGARAGTVAMLNIAGLADTHVTVQGNNVICPAQCSQLLIAYAMSQATAGSLTNMITISSPSLRASSLLELSNWNANGAVSAAAQIPDNNAPFNDYSAAPIQLQPGEAIQCLSSVDAAAVAENIFVIMHLTDGVLAMPLRAPDGVSPPRIETLVADGGSTAVINTWSPTALTFRQALRAGTYAVVGMKASGTSMVAARLVFGNQGPRPGVLATNSPVGASTIGGFGDSVDQYRGKFRYGGMGIWGYFTNVNPPQAEIICSVADTAPVQHFALDVVKVG